MNKLLTKSALCACLVTLLGCGSVREVTPLKVKLPEAYAAPNSVQPVSQSDLRWWEKFQDPVLNSIITIGLAESPTAVLAAARLREAEAQARSLRNWPSGSGEIRGRRVEGVGTEELALDVEWSIFGGRRSQSQAAIERLRAAGFGKDSARLTLLAELAQSYVGLRFLQQTRALRFRDLRSRQRSVETLVDLSQSGNTTRLDVIRAQALVEETRAEIPGIEAAIVAQKNRIATLMGRTKGRLEVDLSYNGVQPMSDRRPKTGVPADLVRNKPEVRQAEALYAAAVHDLGAARGARYPALTLSGSILAPLDSGSLTETIAAGIALPVFQQPRLAALEDAAHARVEQAYAQWTSAVLTAVEEVEAALSAIRGAHASVGHARTLVQLNSEAHELVRAQLAIGSATVLELLDSERATTRARETFAEYKRDHAVGIIALYVALGAGI